MIWVLLLFPFTDEETRCRKITHFTQGHTAGVESHDLLFWESNSLPHRRVTCKGRPIGR